MTELAPDLQEVLDDFLEELDKLEKKRIDDYEIDKEQIKAEFFINYYQSERITNLAQPLRYYDVYLDGAVNFAAYDALLYRTDYYSGREIRNEDDEIISKGFYQYSVFTAMVLGTRVSAPTLDTLFETLNRMK